MPTITISKKELLNNLGKSEKELPEKVLKERISMLGTDLESIEDDEITVEIFPNRPDLLSIGGFSRALKSFLGIAPGLKEYAVKKGTKKVIIDPSVKECRPYTACAIIRMKVTEEALKEMIQIQEKLHITFGRNRKRVAIGIYPTSKIEFPITFKGLKPEEIRFTPLESDKEMSAKEILEEHPKGKEYAHLLEGLKKYACFIDAKERIMSMTPIINSELTGKVTPDDKELFIECSGFDFRIVNEALNMIVTSLAERGAEIEEVILEYPETHPEKGPRGTVKTPNLTPEKMIVDLNYINRLLGLNITLSEAEELIARMGLGMINENKNENKNKDKGNKITVLIPAYRTDILHPVDIAEEIAIAYGYENFEPIIPEVATTASESEEELLIKKIREVMISHGLIETKGYNLISKEDQELAKEESEVEIANSISEKYSVLRSGIKSSLLRTLANNKQYEYPQKIFEIGTIFKINKERETGAENKECLGVALIGDDENFTKIRQIIDSLIRALGREPEYEESNEKIYIPGRGAELLLNGRRIGTLGEVSPEVITGFELEHAIAIAEIDISELFKELSK